MGFAIQPCESAIGVHISPPFEPPYHLPPHPTPEGCRRAPDLSSLRHTANFHLLSILCMVKCMFQCCPPNSPHPLLSQLGPQVSFLCLCLHCCSANSFISTIFLDSMYMLSYVVFACFWLTSLCVTGSSFIPLDSKEIQPVHPKEKWSRSVVYDSFRPHGW